MKQLEKNQQRSGNASSSHELINTLQSQVKNLSQENDDLKKQVDWFKQQFKLASHRQFGKSSETSGSMNLSMVFDEKMEDAHPDNEIKPAATETVTYTRKKMKTAGRLFDVSRFPKEQKIHDLEECDKICGCGNALEKMDNDVSIQVDHIPETFKVIEHITTKYCCRTCETIRSAKKPETAIPKCMATPGFVAEVITKKYEQHLLLYRQSKIFERLGADIPDNTLGNWVMRAAGALMPLGQAARAQFRHVHLLQSDDTKVKTLKP